MKRGFPPLWLSALVLALVLLWRMIGAPVSAQQLSGLSTDLWQARALLPARLSRVLMLWQPVQSKPSDTLVTDGADGYERELTRLTPSEPTMLNVYFPKEERLVSMPLESYVCGVVAAEVPARYHAEALKAQAVAARTRAVWQQQNGGCDRHAGASICADSAHCQGYADVERCRALWGAEYELYRERVMSAVEATRDELLTYGGEPITVMYHAMSGGRTEAAQTVFSQALPYLVSVSSAGEEGAKGFYTDTSYTFEEMALRLNQAFDTLDATPESLRQTLAIGEYTPTGRVASVLVCGATVSGVELRRALGLRSTWFTLSMDESGATFHQQGYGHGVGMSQTGANSMAASGSTYQEILAHYYPGTELETHK